jgi:hypothetical protein
MIRELRMTEWLEMPQGSVCRRKMPRIVSFSKGIYSMFDPIDFDPALAAPWPSPAASLAPYGSGAEPEIEAAVRSVWLETKAAAPPSPAEELQQLLNDVTTELKQQFVAFRKIRVDAEARLATGDEAESKAAKADIKSATDALSLLVRTIEKIDSLQRSLAHDHEIAEQDFDQAAYEQLLADIERKIGERAEERAHILVEQRLAEAAIATGPPPNDTGKAGCGPSEEEN